MKNGQKIFLTLVVGILIIPKITFASWWNPVSWFGNRSFSGNPDAKTQVLENRINELEKRLGDAATSTSPTAKIRSDSTSTTNEPTYQELLKAKQDKATAIRAALGVASSTQSTKFYVKYDNSRIRSCASTDGCDVMGYLSKNQDISLFGSNILKWNDLPEWSEINLADGKIGYVNKSILSETYSVVKEEANTSNDGEINKDDFKKLAEWVYFFDKATIDANEAMSMLPKAGTGFEEVAIESTKLFEVFKANLLSFKTQVSDLYNKSSSKSISRMEMIKELTTISNQYDTINTKLNSDVQLIYQKALAKKKSADVASQMQAQQDAINQAKVDAANSQAQQYIIDRYATLQAQQNAINQARTDAVNARVQQYNDIRAAGAANGATEAGVNAQLNAAGLIRQTTCSFSAVGGMTPGAGSMTCY